MSTELTTQSAPLYGLVLAGGASRRMQRDKAALSYHGKPQLRHAFELLQSLCERVYVSVRADQVNEALRAGLPQIVDQLTDRGPVAGIHAALAAHREAAWLVLACDLPFLNRSTLEHLVAHRDSGRLATAYRSAHDGLPEPLCAIYEPCSHAPLAQYLAGGGDCPRKFLIRCEAAVLDPPDRHALDNINTVEEYRLAAQRIEPRGSRKTIRVQYYAVLREQAGRSREELVTMAATPAALYTELKERHRFHLAPQQLKVAINAEFGEWTAPLEDQDCVVFIPPVAGG
jgi:molybdopterin-guanine dinucleotide biosynthesis protein A